MLQPDKYVSLRIRIKELFSDNKNRYGYRRIHALLRREAIIVYEKIVRQIMKEENLLWSGQRVSYISIIFVKNIMLKDQHTRCWSSFGAIIHFLLCTILILPR